METEAGSGHRKLSLSKRVNVTNENGSKYKLRRTYRLRDVPSLPFTGSTSDAVHRHVLKPNLLM